MLVNPLSLNAIITRYHKAHAMAETSMLMGLVWMSILEINRVSVVNQ